jgi:hypothetical protein
MIVHRLFPIPACRQAIAAPASALGQPVPMNASPCCPTRPRLARSRPACDAPVGPDADSFPDPDARVAVSAHPARVVDGAGAVVALACEILARPVLLLGETDRGHGMDADN